MDATVPIMASLDAVAEVERYCDERVPAESRSEIRIECRV
jgi:hypothetical protein